MSETQHPQGDRIYKRTIASRCSACDKYTYHTLNWGDFYPTACCSEVCRIKIEAEEQEVLADPAEQAELEKLRTRRAILRATLLEEGYGDVEPSPGSSVVEQLLDVEKVAGSIPAPGTEVPSTEENDEARPEVA